MNTVKNKFHLNKRGPSRFGGAASAGQATQAVALVDDRYLAWLAQQQSGNEAPVVLQRAALMPVLSHLARVVNPEAQLVRTCVFADRPPTELLDDLIVRLVPAHGVDGGLGMVRALGQELLQLAQKGGCQQVLIVSDDERLIPYIDEAQWRGVKVVLVADEASGDFTRLMGEDPSWARLLMQADRRVSIQAPAWQALTTQGGSYFMPRAVDGERDQEPAVMSAASVEVDPQLMPDDDWRAQVERVIQDWWDEETPDARLDLYEEMQGSQGVPPETDRHLLLRVRRELARTLSFPEKKAMREMIRATVLAQPPEVHEPG